MLSLTDAAVEHLCSVLEDADAPDNVAARIQLEGNGLVMKFDELRAEDTTIEHEGRTVLVLDEQASNLLSNNTLDVKVTEEGPKLFFT